MPSAFKTSQGQVRPQLNPFHGVGVLLLAVDHGIWEEVYLKVLCDSHIVPSVHWSTTSYSNS